MGDLDDSIFIDERACPPTVVDIFTAVNGGGSRSDSELAALLKNEIGRIDRGPKRHE